MRKNKGITLIALVITIIVLLILAAVSIATLTGENGILTQANKAKKRTEEEQLKEMVKTDILEYQVENNNGNITSKQLRDVLDKYFEDVPEKVEDLQKNLKAPDYSLKAKDEYGNNLNLKVSELYTGNLSTSSTELPKVIVEGKTIELTQENVKNYLGKVVTNFKQDYEGQEETVHIENEDYQVSKKYRLYYVDFENKYGDGEGTIYLKADCTNHNYRLQLDETDAEGNKGIRIKQLNPELYKDKEGNEKASPAVTNPNMQAVTWLLNENNWSSLKNGVTIKTEDINYIVGTPSLEMMMDSYNTKYANVIEDVDKPDYTDITPGGEDRRKLFYQYNNSTNGYQVGPCANDKKEYGDSTSDNSVWTDPNIDTLYYPGKIDDSGNRYWLASPSSYLADCMFGVRYSQGGSIFCDYYYYFNNAFCPLVSLKSTVKLELK